VIELFEEQAARVPDKIAVNYKERSLTFRELNEKANAVAEQLINSGADRNQFVAVIADRGLEMMIALLGVMKSGAAYVPIDPELPQERIEYMLKDCGAKQVVIYGSKIELELKTIVLTAAEKIENVAKNPTVDRSPDDLIYLIYTSGTTGRPKAVMLQHSNVVADIAQFCKKICVTEETVSLQQALYAFDMFVEEVYPTLCSGGEISILPREYAADGMKMSEYINEHKVSLIHCSPLQMNELNQLNILKTVETYIVGSDRLKIEYISNILKKREVRVLQGYGPTETTVVATLHTIKAKGEEWDPESVGVTVPIGKPKDNCKIYILNENTLCGIGVPGELCITGDGLARGYLNQPELTAEKFVDNPFGEGKMYRSGDLARWLSDGNIEFLGRIDEQVKIRGFRIELGEIESRIKEIEGVKDCVVIVRTDKNGDKAIYAYYIGEKEISISEIRDKLSESLPDYMIPSYMMQIESIPVTRNGKLDKRVLPEIKVKVTREYIAPRNEVEKAICDVFEKILHVEKVGIKNNFFELGGDSIKAIRIISELRNIGYTITVKDIMNGKTAEKVALNVKVQLAKRKYEQGEVVGKVEKTPTMCEFERLNLAKPEHFNQATILFVSEFSNEIIHRAVNELVIHHDILRAVYRNNILEILSVSESKLCDFYEFDYSEESDKQRAIEKQCTKIQESIDLENGPLVKIAVFDLGAEKIMMFCIHHLVVDGVSWRILLEDFEIVAEQLKVGKEVKLPEKTASFIEWSNMLNEYVSNSNQDFAYWKNTIEQIAEINFIRTNLNYRADSVDIVIDSKTTKDILYNVNEKYHTKIDDILICALEMAVARWKHKDKIAIAIESHGREEINNEFVIDRTVGWFTSMYPVILQYYDDLEKNIISTKETLRSIPNNGLTYGLFDNQKDVVPDICFNYLGQIDINKQNENSVYYSAGKPIADENRLLGKINFNGSIIDNELHFEISFNQYEIEHNSAILLGEMYENALYDIVKHCVECKETVMTMSDLDTNDLNNDDMNSINDFFDSLFC
ncbi:MAG: amino acid adenylation domain-containing protein, partial [Acutalibacteraceae bacterium]|nr:amino acid adenylation domain-containing protein [Acutalibacteraceae bacterium]